MKEQLRRMLDSTSLDDRVLAIILIAKEGLWDDMKARDWEEEYIPDSHISLNSKIENGIIIMDGRKYIITDNAVYRCRKGNERNYYNSYKILYSDETIK